LSHASGASDSRRPRRTTVVEVLPESAETAPLWPGRAPDFTTVWRRFLPPLLLCGVLLILAVRLTVSEVPIEGFSQLAERLILPPDAPSLPPEPGPGAIVGCSLLTLLLAGGALCYGCVSRGAGILLGLIAAIIALAVASTCHAANHFAALVGTCDLATALLAGWTVMVLATTAARRRLVLAVLLAVLLAWIGKGLYQKYVDIPMTIDYYHQHKAEIWQQHGWKEGDYHIPLFEGRMNSREVTGFGPFANVTAEGLIPLALLTLAMAVSTAKVASAGLNPEHWPVSLIGASVLVLPLGFDAVLLAFTEYRWAAITCAILFVMAMSIIIFHIYTHVKLLRGWCRIAVPVPLVSTIALVPLLSLAGLVLVLTQSKGASAATALGALLLVLALRFGQPLQRHWRRAALLVLLFWIAGTTATVVYGVRHDRLPTRSLMFRWHYWTATVPMVQGAPLWGVGLNNFGQYYMTYKRPTSPEDVKDPHGFFVRAAAELGLPATALLGVLLLVWFHAGAKALAQDVTAESTEPSPSSAPAATGPTPLRTASVMILLWWLARGLLNDRFDMLHPILLQILLAGMAFGGFLLADATCRHAPGALRAATLAILLGALGMLLYDQVNMALLTGPVAMLFCVCLGLTAAPWDQAGRGHPGVARFCGDRVLPERQPSRDRKGATNEKPQNLAAPGHLARSLGGDAGRMPAPQIALGTLLLLLAAILSCTLWLPLVQGTLSWDPRVPESALLAKLSGHEPVDELPFLDAALQCDPRAVELLHRRIVIKARQGQSVRQDIEALLALDRCDAQLRVSLANIPSDWPATQRKAALEEALHLDDQLEPHDRRLTPPQRKAIAAQIAALRSVQP